MTTTSEDPHSQGRLVKLAAFAGEYWTDFCLFFAPAVGAFCAIAFTEEFQKFWTGETVLNPVYLNRARVVWLVVLVASVILLLAAAYFHVRKQKTLANLARDYVSMKADREAVINDMRAVISWYLWGITQDLQFTTSDRLTLYCHDSDISSFLNIQRICLNPAWEGHNRTNYPDNQGFIGQTWQVQEYFIDNLPDPVRNPRRYVRATEAFNFPPGLHDVLRMKSRLYYGWRVNDGNGRRKLAVIMIESTDPARWTQQRLHQYFEEQKGKLHSIFERVHRHLPELSDAAKRGF